MELHFVVSVHMTFLKSSMLVKNLMLVSILKQLPKSAGVYWEEYTKGIDLDFQGLSKWPAPTTDSLLSLQSSLTDF